MAKIFDMKKRNMMKDFKKIIALVILLFSPHFLNALIDGSLDASFNGNGLSVLLDADSTIKATAIQADGKIVAAGSSDINGKHSFLVVRYKSDGTLDTSFGSSGQVVTRFGAGESYSCANAVVIQDDGKIIVAGCTNAVRNSLRWCLARYNTDGSLDQSFYGGRAIFKGTVITFFGNDSFSQANALALSADGKIIAAGMSHIDPDKNYFALARYNTDGSLDEEFNPEGKGGNKGTVRTTFGGVIDNDQAFAVVIQPNGKIVAGGFSLLTGIKTFALARYNNDGSLDTSFFSPGFARYHGTVVTNFACGETEGEIHALLVQADGKIVAGGLSNSNSWRKDVTHFALARYDNRGILDESFGGYGAATVPGTIISSFGPREGMSRINALALQGDGKIIAGGMVSRDTVSHFALARYTADGCVDCSFNDGVSPAGKVITTLGNKKANEIFALALQSNGDIVAVGNTDMHRRPQGIAARYLSKDVLLEPAITAPINNSVIVNGATVQVQGTSQNPGILKIFVDENLVGSINTKGSSNGWRYKLPPMASGNHTVKVLELYKGGNVSLPSHAINITIDQHPKPINATISTCGFNPVNGILEATGASGNYSFSIIDAINGFVTLQDAEYTFTSSIPAGQGSFKFKVTDAVTQCSNEGIVTVVINEVPGAISAELYTCENTAIKGSVAPYVSGGNAPFNFAQVGMSNNGSVVLHNDGTFTFTPTAGFNGVASFQYHVTDAKGCTSDPQTMHITVYEAPKASDGSFTTHEAELLAHNLRALVQGGTAPYTFNLVDCPSNCAISLAPNGSFSLIPTLGFSGTILFKYQVTDAHQCVSNVATISVTVFESPVVASATMSVCQNGQLTQTLSHLVNKGTAPYLYKQVGTALNGVATVAEDGSFTFTPHADFTGEASFNYQVTDVNLSVSNIATVTMIVNELPKLNNASFATCQDSILHATLTSAIASAIEPYSFILVNPATHGLLHLYEDGNFEFVPNQGFNGLSTFQYSITDANGCTSLPAQGTITVHEIPAVQDFVLDTCAHRAIVGTLSNQASGGTPPYSFVIDQTENGSIAVDENGSYIFDPAPNFVGVATITYHAVDAHQCNSKKGTITVTVHPSPVATDINVFTLENAPINGSLAQLVANGIAPYIFSVVDEPLNGNVMLNNDGTYEFIPATDYYGQAGFNYQITDVHGCVSNVAKVIIAVHQLPQVKDHTMINLVNNPISGSLTDFILVGATPFIFQKVTDPIHGNLDLTVEGGYTYTPNTDFVGTDKFQFMVTDAHNGTSNVATISFDIITPVVVTEAVYAGCQDSSISGDLSTKVSGSVAPYTFSIISQPTNGSVALTHSGAFVYMPTIGVFGSDSFNYEVIDAIGLTKATGTVELTIYSKPQVNDTQLTTFEDQPVVGSLASLVSGGKQAYNFVQVDSTINGSVILNSDGTFTFIPLHDFVGTASFTYSVIDANNCISNNAQVNIQVLSLPKAIDGVHAGISNATINSSLLGLVTQGTAPYAFQKASDPLHGDVTISVDGSYSYVPHSDYYGSDSFEFKVVDANQGISNTATMVITLAKPVIIAETKHYSGCPSTLIVGSVHDVVVDGQMPYTFSVIQAPEHGTLQLQIDGSFTYLPVTNFSGIDSFKFAVHDALSSAEGTVNLTIFEGPNAYNKIWTIFESEILDSSVASLLSGGNPPYTINPVGDAVGGFANVNLDGSFTFVPAQGFIGDAHFNYSITDANGCVSAPITAIIQILGLPKAHNGNAIGVNNVSISGSLLSLVTGGTQPYTFQKVTDPLHGTVLVNADGSYLYTANTDYDGVDNFSYSVTDAHNGSATAQVILAVSKPPIISDGNRYQTCANTTVSGDVSGTVSQGIPPYLFSLAQNPNHGTIIFSANGSFAYLPSPGFNGTDTFQFNAIDAIGTIAVGIVTVTVNQTPITQDKTWNIQEYELNESLLPFVTGGNPPYVFNQVGSALQGNVLINADGTFSFTSNIEGPSNASFAYQVTDANNCVSNISTVTIAINPPPSVRSSTFSILQDQPLSSSLAPLMIGGNAPFIFGQVGAAQNGNLVLSRNGSFIFTPNQGFVGNAHFDFIATDKNGASSAVTTIYIVVTEDTNKRSKNTQNKNLFKKYLHGRNK